MGENSLQMSLADFLNVAVRNGGAALLEVPGSDITGRRPAFLLALTGDDAPLVQELLRQRFNINVRKNGDGEGMIVRPTR